MDLLNKVFYKNLQFFKKAKSIFILIGVICFFCLIRMNHLEGFKCTALLPLFYIINTYLFVGSRFLQFGLGTFSLVMFYCVRMCIFPLIIAYGNYFFEPPVPLYIHFYIYSVILMGFENFLIFWIVKIYTLKNYVKIPEISKSSNHSNEIIQLTIIIFTFITFLTFYLKNLDYYHFIAEESVENLYIDEMKEEKTSGVMWYLSDYLSGLLRILLSAWCIVKGYNKWKNRIFSITLLIVIANMLFLTDRRVFALIVSVFCLIYYLRYFANKSTRIIVIFSLVLSICIMGYFYTIVYAHQGGAEMISRSIQRYFSGPSLSALALKINSDIGVVPIEFFKLLHNDFQSLQGLFGKMNVTDFVDRYFPSKGIWTPFVPGSIRYFGIFFPIPLLLCGLCIVKWDSMSRKSNDYLHSMIYSYISFSLSFYLIMYSIELVVYFIIATGCVLTAIVYFDSHYKFKKYHLFNLRNVNIGSKGIRIIEK